MAKKRPVKVDPNTAAFTQACEQLYRMKMFRDLPAAEWVGDGRLGAGAWARVYRDGTIIANRFQRGDPQEWVWAIGHCLLHLGLGHLTKEPFDAAHRAACCVAVARYQSGLKLGHAPVLLPPLPTANEESLAAQWRASGIPTTYADCCVGGVAGDMSAEDGTKRPGRFKRPDFPELFALGLAAAAADAVAEAGTRRGGERRAEVWDRARAWFVSSYPLLGGLAAQFTIVADAELTRAWDIDIAAVDAAAGEIYVNPLRTMAEDEWRFVLAHEMLHAALRHGDRVGPRDPYLWNVACDYVINGWLVEMAVGALPDGVLHDSDLAGLSAEAVYDRIATDLRRLRKLATLRGRGLGDILAVPARATRGVDLDAYYRRALSTGLAYHRTGDRGLLPAGLVEEIRALEHPPLPWDAQLARWFDEFAPARQRQRTYARLSRRQAATPDIPRPGWRHPDELVERCTFGVVLDTSGSMDRQLLGKALGAIASYATARDVPAARVVFCDAAAYDAGYLPPADIAGRVQVRGRGGTVLQPGVNLLERAPDFPAAAPILVITDGECDVVRIRRDHAFCIPEAARLPFTPRGPVFRLT